MSFERRDDAPAGGDPACWLAATCPDCGAIVERAVCWRCGAPREEEE
ncbi:MULTISPECIES: hypothetical protein [Microbacterium]|nr:MULTISPECIES: hypothetical protein [Microbacterium]MCK6065653.1 hypothetical protein [Microbacterium sp. EYE_512]